MNIIICGMPKSGKTTLGKIVSKRLAREFVDTDRLIESLYEGATGQTLSCSDIHRKEGNDTFRFLEAQAIRSLKDKRDCVIAVGGGALQNSKNLALLKTMGKVIYLRVDTTVLLERILAGRIPSFIDKNRPKESLDELVKERTQNFNEAAHLMIDVGDRSTEEIVEIIFNQQR